MLYVEIVKAVTFVAVAFLSLFFFFDFVSEIARAAGRTIAVTLRPDHYPDRIIGPRRIALTSAEPYPCVFHAYRESDAHIATQIEGQSESRLDRILRATEPKEDGLLLNALNQFGRDQMYDGAVVFAAQLGRGIDN